MYNNDVDDYEKGMRETFSLDKYKEMVLEKIVELKTKSKESDQLIIINFMNILSSNIQKQNQTLHIMTISYSSTIYSILLNLIQKFVMNQQTS